MRGTRTLNFFSRICYACVLRVIHMPKQVVKSRMQLGRNPSLGSTGFVKSTVNYRNTIHALMSIATKEVSGVLLATLCAYRLIWCTLVSRETRVRVIHTHTLRQLGHWGSVCWSSPLPTPQLCLFGDYVCNL